MKSTRRNAPAMILTCPECKARFRLALKNLKGNWAYLRCSSCATLFVAEVVENVASASAERHAPSRKTAFGRPVLLLIVRSGSLQQIAITAANQLDLHTIVVSSGEAALRVLSSIAPDIVVVGSELEDVFSFEVIRLIRAAPAFRPTRVLLLSERVVTPRLVRDPSLSFEADRLLDSRVEPADLARAIQEFLPHAKVADQSHSAEAHAHSA